MLNRLNPTLVAIALAALSGCSSWNQSTRKDEPWSISKLWKKEYQQPQSVAAIWAPDVLMVPGRPASRGFGGRLYFYNQKSQAIPVDGELMVHGYIKHARRGESEQVVADKTFGFTAEQMSSHFSPSEMGASYSVWIPWDETDGLRQEITLIPTYKGKDGTIVQGAPAKVNLPGKSTEADEEPRSPMQTVSYTQKSTLTNPGMDNLEEPVKTMRTTTINVPPNASIAKPRRQASFVLGGNNTSTLTSAAANNSPQSEARTGVSTGGSAGRLENDAASPEHQLDQLDRLQRTISPGSNPKGIDVQRLTPPPRADARSYPKVSPLPPPSDPEWTRRRTGVQPASFQEKQ